jgi:hypothetical protein
VGKKRVQRGIDHWLSTGENLLLVDELRFLEKMWGELSRNENDCRRGDETYGYANAESIKLDMEYISDRWFCAFRIKWLIDGLENGKI